MIYKLSQVKRKQHPDVNRQNIDRVVDIRDNQDQKKLTFLKHLFFLYY